MNLCGNTKQVTTITTRAKAQHHRFRRAQVRRLDGPAALRPMGAIVSSNQPPPPPSSPFPSLDNTDDEEEEEELTRAHEPLGVAT